MHSNTPAPTAHSCGFPVSNPGLPDNTDPLLFQIEIVGRHNMRLLLVSAALFNFLTGCSMASANPQKFLDGRINQTVQFPLSHNISKPDQVFNLEWRFIQEEISSSILTFSPNSLHPFISQTFKSRVNFSRSNAVLLLKDIQTTDEGIYQLEVTNAAGKSSKHSVFLTVNVAVSTPQVEMTPEVPQLGDNVTLQCSAQKGNRIQYSWYRCDLPLSSEMNYHLSTNNRSLTIQNVQKSDVGIYRCKVENRISSNHVDFLMQLCLPLSENPVIYGHLGYGGYLGYIGYIILIVLCCQRKIQAKRLSTESETIYENSHISKQMALSSVHNIPKSKQSIR